MRGEKIGTIALTEPDFGSDLGGITTRAVPVEAGWEITGRKMWITSATRADFFTVAAKTDPEGGFKGIDMFLVEKGMPGLQVGRRIHKLGVRASETSEVILEKVVVPAENLMGEQGSGFANVGAILGEIRAMTGALALGLGQAALDASIPLLQRAGPIRPSDRCVPGHRPQGRRYGYRAGSGPRAGVPGGLEDRPWRPRSPPLLHGQAVRHRGGQSGSRRVHPHIWQLWVRHGVRCSALLPRCTVSALRWRDLGDPAHGDRSRIGRPREAEEVRRKVE